MVTAESQLASVAAGVWRKKFENQYIKDIGRTHTEFSRFGLVPRISSPSFRSFAELLRKPCQYIYRSNPFVLDQISSTRRQTLFSLTETLMFQVISTKHKRKGRNSGPLQFEVAAAYSHSHRPTGRPASATDRFPPSTACSWMSVFDSLTAAWRPLSSAFLGT